MTEAPRRYPDIADVLARKAAGRRRLARLSFAEKLIILERLRDRAAPLRRARVLRRRQASPRPAH